ncbi:MAG: hypothetical protein NC344_08855 [Bacteroidales bacterium]|nr:hypothetical protein [Bacteroidales bacterium]MCM1147917.1 hypothetical protein [Bacteroidales bacterium]MCM1205466.1 hypothetical protein [Bacillota bacterium]MCM1509272.1 hypothetical protein [Clostridium sp.]
MTEACRERKISTKVSTSLYDIVHSIRELNYVILSLYNIPGIDEVR